MEEIVCKTSYDYETLLKFQRFVTLKKSKFATVTRIIFFPIVFITIVAELILGIVNGFTSSEITTIIFLVLVIGVYLFLILGIPVISAKKQAKNDFKLVFTFTEEEIKIDAKGLLASESVSIKYEYVKEYYEYDNSFYLFISMNQAYIVNADMLENSNENILRELLKSKIKSK